MRRFATAWIALLLPTALLPADTLEGRWKLVAAEDVRANGEVVRKPWGEHPVGSIVVQASPQGSACYLQIMSTDTPLQPFRAGDGTDESEAAQFLHRFFRPLHLQ